MAHLKQQEDGNVQGAFGSEKEADGNEKRSRKRGPLTVSGATPASTPAVGKSKSAEPEEVKE
jgi:hypothetical protein